MMTKVSISDAASRAVSILRQSPIDELRTLTIDETSEGLCISGRLSRYYYKQMAQETLRCVCKEAELSLRNRTQVFS